MPNTPMIHKNHNVYILGAGFSFDAGLPLMSNFLNVMRDSIDWLDGQGMYEELQAIRNVFNFRLRASSAAHRIKINVENIEDLFSLASASDAGTLMQDVILAIAATLDYARKNTALRKWKLASVSLPQIPSWFEMEDKANPQLRNYFIQNYDWYTAVLSGYLQGNAQGHRNTVITFNYDTVLEDSLDRIKARYHYGFASDTADLSQAKAVAATGSPDVLPILKLHGSLNWGLTSDQKIKVYADYASLRTEKERPLLIPPTWKKDFRGGLMDVWENTVKAIEEATRIIVIGFSLPPTDLHFKYLLAAGLQNNISLRKILFINNNVEQLKKNIALIFREDLKDQNILLDPINVDTAGFFSRHLNLIEIPPIHDYGIINP